MTGYRRDIDGLRAIAVALVVAFHVGIPRFQAGFIGVDVFFVVSGFLITGILVAESDERGTIRLGRFYTRRLRRLLPASSLTVLGTLLATWLLVSPLRWDDIADTAIAATVYAANLFFAREANDYFAADAETNPLLHFWSLAVEEQFYLVWPLLLLGLGKLGARLRLAGLVLVTIASFAHSVALAADATPWAYYSPLSRAWEFSAGAVLALVLPRGLVGRSRWTREGLAWAGLALLGASLLAIDGRTPFPGVAAIPTVLGTSLVLAAAVDGRTPLGWVLESPPFRWIGTLSYSWYLWHWPFLVIGQRALDSTAPTTRIALAVASLGAAAASYHLVEKPIRFAPPLVARQAANWTMAGVLLVVALGGAWLLLVDADRELASPRLAALVGVRDDVPRVLGNDCNLDAAHLLAECRGGADDAGRRILVLGDSHAEMWMPALEEIGPELDTEYVLYILGGCNVAGTEPPISVEACRRVQGDLLTIVDELDPDAVLVSHFSSNLDDADADEWTDGIDEFLTEMAARDLPVGWIHDGPNLSEDPVACVSLEDEASCTEAADEVTERARRLAEREAPVLDRFDVVRFDPLAFMCGDDVCPLSDESVFHYRDEHHVTASYARSVADEFRPLIEDLLARDDVRS